MADVGGCQAGAAARQQVRLLVGQSVTRLQKKSSVRSSKWTSQGTVASAPHALIPLGPQPLWLQRSSHTPSRFLCARIGSSLERRVQRAGAILPIALVHLALRKWLRWTGLRLAWLIGKPTYPKPLESQRALCMYDSPPHPPFLTTSQQNSVVASAAAANKWCQP